MSDQEKLRKQKERGLKAKAILDSEVVQDAFEYIENRITEAWKMADPSDEELVMRCTYVLKGFQSFRDYFKEYMLKGEQAKKELLNLEKQSKLKRVFK